MTVPPATVMLERGGKGGDPPLNVAFSKTSVPWSTADPKVRSYPRPRLTDGTFKIDEVVAESLPTPPRSKTSVPVSVASVSTVPNLSELFKKI